MLKEFIKFLEFIGCVFQRQKGDHLIYKRKNLLRPVVIVNEKEISPFHIRSNLKTLGISKDNKEYKIIPY